MKHDKPTNLKVSRSSVLIEERNNSQLTEVRAQQRPEVSAIFRALSDDKSLTLFSTVALSPGNSNLLTRNLNLTKKQYYSKMEQLSKQGLVQKWKVLLDHHGKNNLRTAKCCWNCCQRLLETNGN